VKFKSQQSNEKADKAPKVIALVGRDLFAESRNKRGQSALHGPLASSDGTSVGSSLLHQTELEFVRAFLYLALE
jgi:hypothetical protein